MKLTAANLPQIKREAAAKSAKGSSDYIAWDDDLKGFGLRLRGSTATFVYQYKINGHHKRVKLGALGDLTFIRARELAKAESGEVAVARLGRGVDPATARAAEREKRKVDQNLKPLTLGALIGQYLEARAPGWKPRSLEEFKRHLESDWKPLHPLPVTDITRAHVAAQIVQLSKRGPASANRARASLSAFYKWAIGAGLCDANPVTGTNKAEENGARDRVLSDAELAAIWLKAPDNDYGRIIKLLMLTASRRDEIGSLRWSEIDLDAHTITLPGDRTKNSEAHVIPLSASALAILKTAPRRAKRDNVFGLRQNAFSGWSKSKAIFDKTLKLKAWRLHDLRRTAATRMADPLGVQPYVIEAALNHISGHKAGVAGIYNRATYEKEKREALDRWAAHLKVIVAKATGANVTPLRKS
jgi:integrase